MTVVLPDASVLLKWVLPRTDEPDAAKAIELRFCSRIMCRKPLRLSLDAAELAGILPKPQTPVSLARMNKVIRKRGAGR